MGGGGPPGGDPDEPDDNDDDGGHADRHNKDSQHKEFTLVSLNKVIILIFTGTNLHTKLYMPFNKAVRKLIKAQGPRGTVLLQILDDVEKHGSEP